MYDEPKGVTATRVAVTVGASTRTMKEAKQRMWEEFGVTMQKDFGGSTKVLMEDYREPQEG